MFILTEERETEITKDLQAMVSFMKVNGVVRPVFTTAWKSLEVSPSIAFDGDDAEGFRVVNLVGDFAKERGLPAEGLSRRWEVHSGAYSKGRWSISLYLERDEVPTVFLEAFEPSDPRKNQGLPVY